MKILHIIPHKKIFPPMGGGMLRCYNIMMQLAKISNLDVLSYQEASEFNSTFFKNYPVNFYSPNKTLKYKSYPFSLLQKTKSALKYRWIRRSFQGPAQAVVLDFEPVLRKLQQNNRYNIIVVEHIQTMMLSPLLRRLWPGAIIIVNAHNIDHKLISGTRLKAKIKYIESTFYKHVNFFMACSTYDLKELEMLNNFKIKGWLVPNGVTADANYYRPDKTGIENKLLFCGSLNYEPNKTGLLWFYHEIWPLLIKEISDIQLTIIGYGDTNNYKELQNDSRINIIGKVNDVTSYYHGNNIAISPLLTGSGTRLKILEAMGFGNPVVTTSAGIEGITATDMEHALIANSPQIFASKIILLINNRSLGNKITHQAYQLVKNNYEWNVVGEKLNYCINQLAEITE